MTFLINNQPDKIRKILVCGGRDFANKELMWRYLDEFAPTIIVHGGATGADRLAGQYALSHKIEVDVFVADWEAHGRKAGPIRNQKMLDESKPDLVLAFPTRQSRGTYDMIKKARKDGYTHIIVESDARTETISPLNI